MKRSRQGVWQGTASVLQQVQRQDSVPEGKRDMARYLRHEMLAGQAYEPSARTHKRFKKFDHGQKSPFDRHRLSLSDERQLVAFG
jgi:hypothetical protein